MLRFARVDNYAAYRIDYWLTWPLATRPSYQGYHLLVWVTTLVYLAGKFRFVRQVAWSCMHGAAWSYVELHGTAWGCMELHGAACMEMLGAGWSCMGLHDASSHMGSLHAWDWGTSKMLHIIIKTFPCFPHFSGVPHIRFRNVPYRQHSSVQMDDQRKSPGVPMFRFAPAEEAAQRPALPTRSQSEAGGSPIPATGSWGCSWRCSMRLIDLEGQLHHANLALERSVSSEAQLRGMLAASEREASGLRHEVDLIRKQGCQAEVRHHAQLEDKEEEVIGESLPRVAMCSWGTRRRRSLVSQCPG